MTRFLSGSRVISNNAVVAKNIELINKILEKYIVPTFKYNKKYFKYTHLIDKYINSIAIIWLVMSVSTWCIFSGNNASTSIINRNLKTTCTELLCMGRITGYYTLSSVTDTFENPFPLYSNGLSISYHNSCGPPGKYTVAEVTLGSVIARTKMFLPDMRVDWQL